MRQIVPEIAPFRAVITAPSVRGRHHFVALGQAQPPSMQQCRLAWLY